jgi:hypothetical protein
MQNNNINILRKAKMTEKSILSFAKIWGWFFCFGKDNKNAKRMPIVRSSARGHIVRQLHKHVSRIRRQRESRKEIYMNRNK